MTDILVKVIYTAKVGEAAFAKEVEKWVIKADPKPEPEPEPEVKPS
jgi:hypothetical protein